MTRRGRYNRWTGNPFGEAIERFARFVVGVGILLATIPIAVLIFRLF